VPLEEAQAALKAVGAPCVRLNKSMRAWSDVSRVLASTTVAHQLTALKRCLSSTSRAGGTAQRPALRRPTRRSAWLSRPAARREA
jgi:hypothetical protein